VEEGAEQQGAHLLDQLLRRLELGDRIIPRPGVEVTECEPAVIDRRRPCHAASLIELDPSVENPDGILELVGLVEGDAETDMCAVAMCVPRRIDRCRRDRTTSDVDRVAVSANGTDQTHDPVREADRVRLRRDRERSLGDLGAAVDLTRRHRRERGL
jgi:hypothetical protein